MLLTLCHVWFSSYRVLKMKNIEKHHFEEFQVVAVVKDRGLHIHVYTTMEKMSGIYSLFIKSSQFYILE